jgi:hypothetical protein
MPIRPRLCPLIFLIIFVCGDISYSQLKKPLDPIRANTNYTFEVHRGTRFTFHVDMDAASTIRAVQVFRGNEKSPFQTLSACDYGSPMQLFEGDEQLALVEHDDLDFDGYQDLKLLTLLNDHLGTKVFCVYLWSTKTSQFRYEKQLLIADPIPHTATRTITSHSEYQGGTFIDYTYKWRGTKLVLVAEDGTQDDAKHPECGPVHFSARLVNGNMRFDVDRSEDCSGGTH